MFSGRIEENNRTLCSVSVSTTSATGASEKIIKCVDTMLEERWQRWIREDRANESRRFEGRAELINLSIKGETLDGQLDFTKSNFNDISRQLRLVVSMIDEIIRS